MKMLKVRLIGHWYESFSNKNYYIFFKALKEILNYIKMISII